MIISSSDDEGRGVSASGDRGSSESRSRSAAARKRPRGGRLKKSDGCSGARSHDASHDVEAVKFDMLSEEFSECLHDFGIVPGFKCIDRKELWVDKHKPRSLAELAVHKKKIEEVKEWLEERVKTSKDGFGNCALLITGQAGVGKSAAIHVIASQLGAELSEWTTPTPTLWQEHLHNTNSGIRYTSKLDEFETFVEKTRKYCLLHPTYTGGSRKPVILLIDDLPVTNGRVAFVRLSKCLTTLAHSSKVPTVILITEYHKTESVSSSRHYWEELEVLLERAGAYKVAFNPITVNSIKKTLSRICQEENCDVASEWIDHIAKASGGDIRHAITTLQYCCLRPDKFVPLPLSTQPATHLEVNPDKPSLLSFSSLAGDEDFKGSIPLSFGRDETLTLFHALGKFLHNKREILDPSVPGPISFVLQERFKRNPLKMDAPEKVLSQAQGQARPIADFLHENVLDFISDDAIDDARLVTSYLSDVDCLLASPLPATWSWMISGIYESDSVVQAVAASVAVRGVLFGNSHPSPSRWHTIRSPRLWQTEQSSRHNKNQMLLERFEAYGRSSSCNMSHVATEYRPRIKWLRSHISSDVHALEKSWQNPKGEEDDSEQMGLDNYERNSSSEETEEDEIEDW